MKRFITCVLLVFPVLISVAPAFATPGIMKRFIAVYPAVAESQLATCRTCHMPVISSSLNGYAIALRDNGLDFKAIEGLDSDGDGRGNLEEISAKELPGSQAGADELFLFTARMGNVTFNHEAHSLDPAYGINGKCVTCHGENGFPRRFDDTVTLQKMAHEICKECHKNSGNENAPKQCRQCHIKN